MNEVKNIVNLGKNAVGKRKTARAHVIANDNTVGIIINKTYSLEDYFKCDRLIHMVNRIINLVGFTCGFNIKLNGGGKSSQAQAVQFALMKIIIKKDEEWKKKFKELGFVFGDSRQVQPKKIGLKKARKGNPFKRR